MANIKKQLAALLDTEPKHLDIHVAIVNPSGAGSWVAVCELAGIRVIGSPADDPAGAARNLFDRLTAARGYSQDTEVAVALEMSLSSANLENLLRPELEKAPDEVVTGEFTD